MIRYVANTTTRLSDCSSAMEEIRWWRNMPSLTTNCASVLAAINSLRLFSIIFAQRSPSFEEVEEELSKAIKLIVTK